jgi:hypothetical protein
MVSETAPMVLAGGHKHTMALAQCARPQVLEVLRAGEVNDRIRRAAETMIRSHGKTGSTTLLLSTHTER